MNRFLTLVGAILLIGTLAQEDQKDQSVRPKLSHRFGSVPTFDRTGKDTKDHDLRFLSNVPSHSMPNKSNKGRATRTLKDKQSMGGMGMGVGHGKGGMGSAKSGKMTKSGKTKKSNISSKSVMEAVESEQDLGILASLLVLAGFDELLEDPFFQSTVFAPTDDVFDHLEEDEEELLIQIVEDEQWILHLRALLSAHVVPFAIIYSTDLVDGLELPTGLEETRIFVSVFKNEIFLSLDSMEDVPVVQADLVARNGILHKIGYVLIPDALWLNIIDVAAVSEDFSIMYELVIRAGLESEIRGRVVTVIAPINAAFPEDQLPGLRDPANVEALKTVLLYHLIEELYPTDFLTNSLELKTLQGSNILHTFTVDPAGEVTNFFNNIMAIAVDLIASNAVVHAIIGVLAPPPPAPFLLADVVAGESDLTVFQSFALITPSFAQNLLGASIPTTILAPTDDAFANFEDQDLLTRLMQPEWTAQRQLFLFGHAVRPEAFPAMFSSNITDGLSVGTFVQQNPVIFNVRDDGIFVARSGFGTAHQVLEADLIADNGVLHKIGGVLNQVTFYVDIIDLAATLPVFSTMTALLMQTGLDALLRSGLYTVLAPINQGFEALPAEILEFLTDPANEDSLRKVLLYHIVPGLYPSVLLSSGQELVTVEGSTVQFSLVPQEEGPPRGFFNSVPVVSVDLGGKQAVAHSIFGVLVPPGITLP